MRTHHLLDSARLEAMRAIVVEEAAAVGPASARVEAIRRRTTAYIQSIENGVEAQRGADKRTLRRSISGLDDMLLHTCLTSHLLTSHFPVLERPVSRLVYF